jgi:hypothetical protein
MEMSRIIEIHDKFEKIGIKARKVTQGTEFDLVQKFIAYKKGLFRSSDTKHLMIFVEPQLHHSYPDIVFVEYNPNCFENWNSARFDLNKNDYKICYHMYINKNIGAEDIVAQLGLSWKETTLSIERLYDAGLVERFNGYWRLKDKDVFGVKKIQAVEAKINKLDVVLQQAMINKNFASESYVLSNVNKGIEDPRVQRYCDLGIGLYTQSDKQFKLISKSRKRTLPVSFSSIYFNEWIGKILTTSGGKF